LIAWQYFYNVPQMEKQRAQTQTQAELAQADAADHAPARPPRVRHRPPTPPANTRRGRPPPSSAAMPRLPPPARQDRDPERGFGSISLKGARIDDLSLVKFRDTVRSDLAADRAVLAVEHREPLLRRVRLGPGIRLDHADFPTRPRFGSREGIGSPFSGASGHAEIRQMATASPPPHHFDRTTAISSP